MMKIINEAEDRSHEYDEYLNNHIQGVKDSWYQILRPSLEEIDGISFSTIDEVIEHHDESKYDEVEYIPYLNHFYPTEDHPNDEVAFDLAWLHHQHHNPHHWQHWLLQKDSGKLVTMDMPQEYVAEMLCDWHSFSRKDPSSTAYAWWEKNKDKMVMSKVTKERVNYMIKIFKDNPLGTTTESIDEHRSQSGESRGRYLFRPLKWSRLVRDKGEYVVVLYINTASELIHDLVLLHQPNEGPREEQHYVDLNDLEDDLKSISEEGNIGISIKELERLRKFWELYDKEWDTPEATNAKNWKF